MYNCGPTVYDRAHIGNMRSFVMADLVRRVLEYNGYVVKQVINITDVGHLTGDNEGDADTGEDKLEKRAKETGEDTQTIAKKYTELFFEDIKRLNIVTEGTQFPRATEYIGEQIALVETLEQKGYAYTIKDGVYFDTSRFAEYGKLGKTDKDGIEEGARVLKNPEKRNPTDFALWKFSPPKKMRSKKRQQEWDSPWGVGFPGWHLECSAMARALLGKQIDIHTGGVDHIPIHHNNEIAQSECSTGKKPFARFWLHNAFITIEGRRIGKSIGNTVNLDQLADRGFPPLSYRYWLLTAHYRTPANFTWEALEGARTSLLKLHRHFVDELAVKASQPAEAYMKKFTAFVNDDLDTPKAVALLWDLVKDDAVPPSEKRAAILEFDKVLGLGFSKSNEELASMLSGQARTLKTEDMPEELLELVRKREEARERKDFGEADTLRAEIETLGYLIKDTPEGPKISARGK